MKKIIIIATGILISILLFIFLLTRLKNQAPTTNFQPLITPTLVETYKQSPIDDNQSIVNNALSFTPYEDENFLFYYSPETNQLTVEEKTPEAYEKFIEWATQNGLDNLAANPELINFQSPATSRQPSVSSRQSQDFNPIIEFINIFLNLGQGSQLSTNNQSPTSNLQSPTINNQSPVTSGQSLVYYAQCDSEYADLPLPDGCSMCQAGCGAATVAMIASSYLGKQYDPRNIINQYKSKGYLLSCAGSRYSDARTILQSLGLRTTDYIAFNYETADQIVNDLRKYLKAGWTFFTLANFKENGGGHFFWITDIDEKGNIWAYDPYYGRFEAPPINENSRYPFPKYRITFGVKR